MRLSDNLTWAHSPAQKQRHFLLLSTLHLCQQATWLTPFTFKLCFPFKMALSDPVWMDPSWYNSQACGGAQVHGLEHPQILNEHNIVLHGSYLPFSSLVSWGKSTAVCLRGYSCKALVLLVSHSPGEGSWHEGLEVQRDWASRAENHTAIEKVPGSLSYFSVSFLSTIYIMTFLRAHFPQLHFTIALVKEWWLQSDFLDWLSSGSVEVQQPPYLRWPLQHWDIMSFHLKEGEKDKMQVELQSSSWWPQKPRLFLQAEAGKAPEIRRSLLHPQALLQSWGFTAFSILKESCWGFFFCA